MLNRKRLKLNKNDLIVFVGSMNAMPMMYAHILKSNGYNVVYFVDRNKHDTLCRPENHFPEISYPYPDWIIENIIYTQISVALFPEYYARKILKQLREKVQCFVLNGFFISLIPYLPCNSFKISLSHGSDIDTWADTDGINNLQASFKEKTFFKFLPKLISDYLIKKIVLKQYASLKESNALIYFPKGFNQYGDRVLEKLKYSNVMIFERYDISFEPLKGQTRTFKNKSSKIVIFSGVRFLYKSYPEGNKEYNKGNDIIIKGLHLYHNHNKNIEIHFVEKGEDVDSAKALCTTLGLNDCIVWHNEMSFKDLLSLYSISDVCFDQVGSHWIGAIGGYALWLGKPLIANIALPIKVGLWPDNNPILHAENAEDIFNHLKELEDENYRKEVSEKSISFVEEYMNPQKLLISIFDFPEPINQ